MKFDGGLALLLVCAIGLALAFYVAHLPAAWLFGPLAVSVLFAVRGWRAVQFPQPVYLAAQAVIGTALGAEFLPKTLLIIPMTPRSWWRCTWCGFFASSSSGLGWYAGDALARAEKARAGWRWLEDWRGNRVAVP